MLDIPGSRKPPPSPSLPTLLKPGQLERPGRLTTDLCPRSTLLWKPNPTPGGSQWSSREGETQGPPRGGDHHG